MGWVTGILIWDLDWMWRIVWVRVRDLLHLKFALILAFCLALFDESGRGRWIFVCYVYLGSRIVTLLPRLAFWNLQFKRGKLVNNIRVSIFASPKLHGSVHKYKRYAILVQILFLGSVTYLSGFQLLLLFWTWFESLTFIHPPKKNPVLQSQTFYVALKMNLFTFLKTFPWNLFCYVQTPSRLINCCFSLKYITICAPILKS